MSKSIQLVLKTLSYLGLAMTVVPSILVFTQTISHDRHITLMGIGMVVWFATAPFWINKESKE